MELKFSKKIFGTIVEKRIAKPECIGRYLGFRIGNRSVIELCSCLGVQSIQIAKFTSKSVLGIDIKGDLVYKARKNAGIYNVRNVDFQSGDALCENFLKRLSAEVFIMDPHWSTTCSLQGDFTQVLSGTTPKSDKLIAFVRKYISGNIIIELPPTIKDSDLILLGKCEIQKVFINGVYRFKIVYFGDLMRAKNSRMDFAYEKEYLPFGLAKMKFGTF